MYKCTYIITYHRSIHQLAHTIYISLYLNIKSPAVAPAHPQHLMVVAAGLGPRQRRGNHRAQLLHVELPHLRGLDTGGGWVSPWGTDR